MPTQAITSSPFQSAPIKAFDPSAPSTLSLTPPAQQAAPQAAAPSTSMTAATVSGLDPTIVNLAKSIRSTETSLDGNFTASGKSGEYGAYQFTAPTWDKIAPEIGINTPYNQASPQEQNAVAYKYISDLKAKGYNVGQIASIWNSGKSDPTGNVGTNSYGASYDTPAYVNKVYNTYQQLKGQTPAATTADTNQTQTSTSPGLLPDLGKDANDLGTALTSRLTDLGSAADTANQGGVANIGSGLLQGAGAIAGGVGDLINAGLEIIPGVQWGESKLGQAVSALGGTALGQQVGQGLQQFATDHPTAAKNIGAIVNIASVFPMFKALGIAKDAAAEGVTQGLRGGLEKAATQEISDALPSKVAKSIASAGARGLDPIGALVKDGTLPKVIERAGGGFEYSSTDAAKTIQEGLSSDESQLQNLLKKAVKKNVGVNMEDVRKQVLKDVGKEYSMSGNYNPAIKAVNEYFDSVAASTPKGRSVIDLNELNDVKRDVRGAVNFDNLGTQRSNIRYNIGQSIMNQVEKIAGDNGIKGVSELNKTMGQKIESLKILKALDGKTVKTAKGGLIKEMVGDAAGAAGEMAGNATGVPFAGALTGRGLGRALLKPKPASVVARLSKTTLTKGAVGKGLAKGLLGMSAQQLQKQ